MTELEQRVACLSEAADWVPTPFHYSANIKHVGCACGPYLIECYRPYSRDSGRALPNPPPFPKDWAHHNAAERFQAVILAFCGEVDVPQPGDLALFRLGSASRPFSHGAIIQSWPEELFHAYHRGGVEKTTAYQSPLRPELAKFYSPWAWIAPRAPDPAHSEHDDAVVRRQLEDNR